MPGRLCLALAFGVADQRVPALAPLQEAAERLEQVHFFLVAPKTPSSSLSAQSQLALLFDVKRDPAPKSAAPRKAQSGRTWQVRQIVAEARDLVEEEFGDVWVEGEISNCRPASSGHCYFTLKDVEAQLPVVLFRRQAVLLRFRLDDGLHVRVRGRVSVYEQRGQLQLIAETVEPVGAGSLQLAFEQLRDRLKAEGLFDAERKRLLPAFPRTVAVVTSPTGAVIRDFLNVVNRRHSGLSVVVVPVSVQGDNAVFEIEAALEMANRAGVADLIVLARGGGSLEDLAAFNSERVARAIAGSRLAVVSAIGHETDFTIADFVSDLRAPTPSAAAELVTETQHKVEEFIAGLTNRLVRAARFQLLQSRQKLGRVPVTYAEQRMTGTLHRLEQRVDDLTFRLQAVLGKTLAGNARRTAELHGAVLRHDPRRQLSVARQRLADQQSRMHHALERQLASVGYQRGSVEARLYRAGLVAVAERRAPFGNLRDRLHSLSPLAVLERGYALVQDEEGKIVRSVDVLRENQEVFTHLGSGSFSSRVLSVQATRTSKAERKTKDGSAS